MKTVKINLDEHEASALFSLAEMECRTIHQQAKFIILKALDIKPGGTQSRSAQPGGGCDLEPQEEATGESSEE